MLDSPRTIGQSGHVVVSDEFYYCLPSGGPKWSIRLRTTTGA
jgi:hypothetical protein